MMIKLALPLLVKILSMQALLQCAAVKDNPAMSQSLTRCSLND